MPGLLKDNSDSDSDSNQESSGSTSTLSSSPASSRLTPGASTIAAEMAECVSSQEWLVGRYRHLRRELEDVDRQITRLRRNMERQALRRQQYQHNLERATAALTATSMSAAAARQRDPL